jgi:hypothetical protein
VEKDFNLPWGVEVVESRRKKEYQYSYYGTIDEITFSIIL